ncbi:polymorphic toxin type 44 domain-containing protein [Brevibacillus sp. NRS-1366]|uniref:polymorphic toxin type 44 domain-containing protein n=1 Tax=Brevibacillus sp. NRS-1366 TaxID=3233899 RepID=UPI003D1B3514
MKKLVAVSFAAFLLFSGFSQVRAAEVVIPEINNVTDLHKYTITDQKEDLKLRSDGTLDISKVNFEGIDPRLVNEYEEVVISVNEEVENGIVKFTADFEVVVATEEELIELSERSESSELEFSNRIMPMADPDEPRSFSLENRVYTNLEELQTKERGFEQAAKLNPTINPWLSTATFFAVQVRPGGPWDYKREIGWNNLRTVKVNGTKYYLTGEDIGNIHYGFVGRDHFSKKTLLSAAGMVQILVGTARLEWFDSYFDDPTDQAAIARGITWYETGDF